MTTSTPNMPAAPDTSSDVTTSIAASGALLKPNDAPTPNPTVRVEGLANTLGNIDHELQLLSHATKYNWINHRLILLRNALIAFSILVVVVTVAVACYREAYRQTMTIAAFDVPENLAERGITGHVIAKALFDELIKRRALVTTLETGELKGAWAENRSDVAIPESKFTLQSLFRYLRYMTGNEIAIDGEFILNGEDVTMKVRVAGKPPKVVKGKLADWESMVGELALGVLEVTQPAVLAAYMGIKAQTPEDIRALSKHIVAMQNAAQKPSAAVMSVAYDAYGSALVRQSRQEEARAAFAEAMALDPTNGVAVINAADAQNALRNYAEASVLYVKAQNLRLPDTVKATALVRRVAGATSAGDCPIASRALQDAKASPNYMPSFVAGAEALYMNLRRRAARR
jgi:tetratricopeptide (TPR) repeat protein